MHRFHVVRLSAGLHVNVSFFRSAGTDFGISPGIAELQLGFLVIGERRYCLAGAWRCQGDNGALSQEDTLLRKPTRPVPGVYAG